MGGGINGEKSAAAFVFNAFFQLHSNPCEDYIMPLIDVVVTLIVVGVILWLVNRFIPMAGSINSILNAVVVIAVVLWLLDVFGILDSFSTIRIG